MTPVLRKLAWSLIHKKTFAVWANVQMLFINMFLSFLFCSKDPDFINAERLRLHAARIKKKAATKKHNKGKSKKVAFQANRKEK